MHKTLTPALAAFAAGRTLGPVGYRRNGSPIFAIAGGAPDDSADGKDSTAGGDSSGSDGSAGAGKTFTQAEVDAIVLKRAERVAADKYAGFDDYRRKAEEFDKAAEAARSEQEKAVDAARTEGEQAATERANTRLVKAEARALAAQAGFRSLADVSLLDLTRVNVSDDGTIDTDAIKAELKSLSDADPWRIDNGKKPAPRSDKSQGGGGGNDNSPSVSSGRDLYAARRGLKTT